MSAASGGALCITMRPTPCPCVLGMSPPGPSFSPRAVCMHPPPALCLCLVLQYIHNHPSVHFMHVVECIAQTSLWHSLHSRTACSLHLLAVHMACLSGQIPLCPGQPLDWQNAFSRGPGFDTSICTLYAAFSYNEVLSFLRAHFHIRMAWIGSAYSCVHFPHGHVRWNLAHHGLPWSPTTYCSQSLHTKFTPIRLPHSTTLGSRRDSARH